MKINILSFRKWLVSVFNPLYQLILDKKIEDPSTGQFLYLFKQYGSHDFVKISYQDICNSIHIMQTIHPDDMKQIHISEYQEQLKNQRYKITNYLTQV